MEIVSIYRQCSCWDDFGYWLDDPVDAGDIASMETPPGLVIIKL